MSASTSLHASPLGGTRRARRRTRVPLLPSVCLVAIVRDEASNPAGGIAAFLERIVPAVHSALILDTGSTDGTLQTLHEFSRRHTHMQVRSAPFASFAHARNLSLQMALEAQRTHEAGREERARALASERAAHAAAAPTAAAAAGILAAPLPAELPPFRHFLVLDADEVLAPASLTLLASILALDQGSFEGPHSAAVHPYLQAAAAMAAARNGSCAAAASAQLPLSYPFCLKFSCHCFGPEGEALPRSNSGLWNPRVFSADPRFTFVNTVDDFRFERLLFRAQAPADADAGDSSALSAAEAQPVEAGCYVREGHLHHVALQQLSLIHI